MRRGDVTGIASPGVRTGLVALLGVALMGGCAKRKGELKDPAAKSAAAPRPADMSAQAAEARGAADRMKAAKRPSAARPSRALQGLARRRGAGPTDSPTASATPSLSAGRVWAGRFATLQVVAGRKIPHMYFKHWGVNPTIDTEEAHVSTFGADVDTASYALVRSYLERNVLPPEAAIRVEELINAFDYGYAPPVGTEPLRVHAEVLPSPNRRGYHVLRIGVQAHAVKPAQRLPAHLVLVVDASATMARQGRLALVKRALDLLVGQLRRTDQVAIVAFDTTARVVLPATPGHRKAKIRRAITGLKPRGSADAHTALTLGFRLAAQGARGHLRRVILCTDGVAGKGVTSARATLQAVRGRIRAGVTLTAVGFGMGFYNDRLLEALARGARGSYHYVDALPQARRLFVQRLTGTLQGVARDVKLQVTFDKRAVSRYRLLGYESRMLQARAFRKRRTPAGELGAGQSVTALYEVKLRGGARALGTLRLRYKRPGERTERQLVAALPRPRPARRFAQGSAAARLAVVVAAFAEKLRGSYWARNLTYARILTLHRGLGGALGRSADVVALRELIRRAARLDKRGDRFAQILPLSRMTFDRVPVRR